MQEEQYTIPQMVDDVREGKLARRQFIKSLTLMGITTAGVGAIAAAAARSFPAASTHQAKLDKAVEAEKLTHLHDQHLAKQSTGDVNGLQNDYAMDAVVEDSFHPVPFVGRDAIMARKNVGFAAVSNAKIAVTNRVVHGQQVTVEWVASGTHTGDLPGLPASGRAYTIHGVTVVVREDSKIIRESIYFDAAYLRSQLS